MVLPISPAVIKRSKSIPAAAHPPGTNQKVNIVPVPVPSLNLLPATNQKSKNLPLNPAPLNLNLHPPRNLQVPKQ